MSSDRKMKECERLLQQQVSQPDGHSQLLFDSGFEAGWRVGLKKVKSWSYPFGGTEPVVQCIDDELGE